MCNFKRHHLTVEIAGDPNKEALLQGEQSFAEALDEAYVPVSADKENRAGISPSM